MLPIHKADVAAVEELAKRSNESWVSEIPQLIEWLKDGNWPVAVPVANLLAGAGGAVIPHLSAVLRGNDSIWKYWCIELLAARLPPGEASAVSVELRHLSQHPSPEEVEEGVNVAAARELARAGG